MSRDTVDALAASPAVYAAGAIEVRPFDIDSSPPARADGVPDPVNPVRGDWDVCVPRPLGERHSEGTPRRR